MSVYWGPSCTLEHSSQQLWRTNITKSLLPTAPVCRALTRMSSLALSIVTMVAFQEVAMVPVSQKG